MSPRAVVTLEWLGVVLVLAGIGAGVALVKDHHIEPVEAGLIGGLILFGAILIDAKRVVGPLVQLVRAWKGGKAGSPDA